MKIYTATGDGGKTSLFSGERLRKSDVRVAAYGTVDELCSYIGVIESALPEAGCKLELTKNLQTIQADLFNVGAILSTSKESADSSLLAPLNKERITWLEKNIDAMQADLEELRSFILPGGHPSAAWAQVARTVCRRAEREIVALIEIQGCLCSDEIVGYINRLSDYFFVLARYLNKISNTEEITWHG